MAVTEWKSLAGEYMYSPGVEIARGSRRKRYIKRRHVPGLVRQNEPLYFHQIGTEFFNFIFIFRKGSSIR